MRRYTDIGVAAILLAWCVSSVRGAESGTDWPCFQGPRGDGSSPETGLLRQWPNDGPAILWRAKIGQGWGSPAVVGDRVYLCWSADLRGGKEVIACLDAANGHELWQQSYPTPRYWERNIGWAPGGVRATPCVAGDYVFTLGEAGHLHCLDRGTGKIVWKQDLYSRWSPSGEKGYCFSPLVAGGKLILFHGDGPYAMDDPSETRGVVCEALDPASGKVLWTFREKHRPGPRFGEGQTPAITTLGGETCVLITANAQLKALRVRDGKQVWAFDCISPTGRGTTIPTPLVVENLIVNVPDLDFMHVVDFDRQKPDSPARILWKKDMGIFTAIHQFRHHEGFLYGFTGEIIGESERSASDSKLCLTCVDLRTGQVKWKEAGFKTGVSHLLADGLLFVRSFQTLRLVEASPDGYRLKGQVRTHDVNRGTVNLTDFVPPVLSRGKLLVRTPDELICYDVRAPR